MFKYYKYRNSNNIKSTLEDPFAYGCKHNGVGGEPEHPGMKNIPNQSNSEFGDMYDQWRKELGYFDPNNRHWREQYMQYGIGPHYANKSYHCPPSWMDMTGTVKVTEKNENGIDVEKDVSVPGLCGTDIPVCKNDDTNVPNPIATGGVDDYYDNLNEPFFMSSGMFSFANILIILVVAFLVYHFICNKGSVKNLPKEAVSTVTNSAKNVVNNVKKIVS